MFAKGIYIVILVSAITLFTIGVIFFLLFSKKSGKGLIFRRADWDGTCISMHVEMPSIMNCTGEPNVTWFDSITLTHASSPSTGRSALVIKLFPKEDWSKSGEDLKQDLSILRAPSNRRDILHISIEKSSLLSNGTPIVHLSFGGG